ncbi:hypothetical protein Vadar_000390 [Vaccinium darrowii]|uniref:Uncharacterized protein n=1 Tax=Vaccinium darrowii TaxID=229202 RepID=A0ACB7X6F5_9ERIC|nr:hypothetical protein Vadar_000390 [Vaccinium darrowii]
MEETREIEKNINAYLPYDILTRIFLLFPFKSVLRLKSVCKVWNAIIKDQDFANMHLENRHAREPSGAILICHSTRNGTEIPIRTIYNGFPDEFETPSFDVHFSCFELGGGLKNLSTIPNLEECLSISTSINGLICLQSYYSIRVCNPWTRDVITLPLLPANLNMGSGRVTLQGFGYSPSTKEYKVVGYVRMASCIGRPQKYVVITLGSPAWRALECNIHYLHAFRDNAIGIGGHIYWIACTNSSREEYIILALNVQTEEFLAIDTPPQACWMCDLRLVELHQRLCLVNGFDSNKNYKFKSLDLKIWMLQESNREWILKHQILLHSFQYDGVVPMAMEFFYVHKGKLVFKPEETTLWSFDLATGNFESIFNGDMNFVHRPKTTLFEESLTSLPSIDL